MHNIYRNNGANGWENVVKIEFPDGQIMDDNNHDFTRDGYFWSEEPPTEFLEWKAEQDEITNI